MPPNQTQQRGKRDQARRRTLRVLDRPRRANTTTPKPEGEPGLPPRVAGLPRGSQKGEAEAPTSRPNPEHKLKARAGRVGKS